MPPRALPPIDILPRANQYTARSEGIHISDIIGNILMGIDPKRYTQHGAVDIKYMNFMMGLVFEQALVNAWLDREFPVRPNLIRPGELVKEGTFRGRKYRVVGTPDALDLDHPSMGRPEEYKCSKKSCRQPITDHKFRHYWWQLKSYAYMLGVNCGALYVLHINGNYSRDDDDPESGYIIKPWEDEWTELELEENWFMLIQRAYEMEWF